MNIRKNIRIENYDYSQKGMYFITICAKDMKHIFGVIDNNEMILNKNGNIVDNIFKEFKDDRYSIKYYQIMPNHVHFIIELLENGKIKLASVVSMIKGKCSFMIKEKEIWQKGYYDRVVRNEREYENIVKYIVNNSYRDKYKWW